MTTAAGVLSDIDYVAEVRGVREVALEAEADRDYWDRRLAPEGLAAAGEGPARLLFTAARGRWMGVRFHDFSFGVYARASETGRVPSGAEEGLYFVEAFNSSRFFALVERRWFRTPYSHQAALGLDVRMPVWARIGGEGRPRHGGPASAGEPGTVFAASMGAADGEERRAESSAEVCWEGPLFLPTLDGASRRHFFVRLAGHTRTYPFDGAVDRVRWDAAAPAPVVAALGEGGFEPRTWIVRADALHARSKTYKALVPPGRGPGA